MKFTLILLVVLSFGDVNSATTTVEPDYVYFSYNQSHEIDYGDITDLVNTSDGKNFSYDPIYNISFGGLLNMGSGTDNCSQATDIPELKTIDDGIDVSLSSPSRYVHINFTNIPLGNFTLLIRAKVDSADATLDIRYCNGNLNGSGDILNTLTVASTSFITYEIPISANTSIPNFDLNFSTGSGILQIDYIALSTKHNFIHSRFNLTYNNIFVNANLVYNLTIINNNTQYRIYNCSGTKNTSLISNSVLSTGNQLLKIDVTNFVSKNKFSYFDVWFNDSISIDFVYLEIMTKEHPQILNLTFPQESQDDLNISVGVNYSFRVYIQNEIDEMNAPKLYLTNGTYYLFLGVLSNESSNVFGYWNNTLQTERLEI